MAKNDLITSNAFRIDRRQFGLGMAAVGASLVAAPALAESRAKVVVIGGGPGGATVAGTLKLANAKLDVTLIEPQRYYTTCFLSNFYLGGLRTRASLTQSYEGLAAAGIRVIRDRAAGIDLAKKSVRLADGGEIAYDRLVVAPGIGFKYNSIQGYSEEAAQIMPTAWSGGAQLKLLRQKLLDMDDGGLVVIAPPRNPYRCPPGPYERACAIAHYLKTAKPKSKLVILDPKMAFSKQPVFQEAFEKYYKDIIELHLTNDIDDMSLARVDPKTGEVVTKAGAKFKAAVANIIPDQHAGDFAIQAGLADGDWCQIHPENFKSVKSDAVYVLGDSAAAAEMPKSAFSANNQAKVVAADILADLARLTHPQARYRNTCWSLLSPGDSVKIGADYAPGDIKGKHVLVPSNAFVSQPGESAVLRKEVYDESLAWYDTLVASVFMTDRERQEGSARRNRG
jgi:NADPH-dependent 2,4-dienoyl-CoA reductase/sulfur reductase-like enzyme